MAENILLLEKSIGIDPHKSGWSKVSENHNKPTLPPENVNAIEESSLNSLNLAAAIPNPLARIHLFQNAFNYFASKINAAAGLEVQFEGPYAEIVSDALDFLQLLFSHAQRDAFEATKFDITVLDNLQNGNKAQKRITDSIRQYFDEIQSVTLISYKTSGKSYLIGGTSPFTIVYTSPNWRETYSTELVKNSIKFADGKDDFFDDNLTALENRSEPFRAYCKFLADKLPLGNSFKNYINALVQCDATKSKFKFQDDNGKNRYDFENATTSKVINGREETVKVYEYIKVGDYFVTVNGEPIFYSKFNEDPNKINSSFKLDTRIYSKKGFKFTNSPLVLSESMTEIMNGQTYFGSVVFKRELFANTIRSNSDSDINSRIIPGTQINYPFICEKDFFTDELFVLPYKINTEYFFTGCANENSNQCNFLLPLRELVFSFFDFQSLSECLNVEFRGDSVYFSLLFRAENGDNIKLTKSYPKPQDKKTKIEPFALSVFPMVKYMEAGTPKFNNHHLTFYPNITETYTVSVGNAGGAQSIEAVSVPPNRLNSNTPTLQFFERKSHALFETSCHIFVPSHFDYILLKRKSQSTESGMIVPLFDIKRGANKVVYRVGIDFGTSNSHVAVKKGDDGLIEDLSIENGLIGHLHASEDDLSTIRAQIKTIMPIETNPKRIGSGGISFPLRTALVHKAITPDLELNPLDRNLFSFSNIGFFYELDNETVRSELSYFYATEIKPTYERDSSFPNETFVENFIFHLLWLSKVKSILDDYRPDYVQFRWTYPSTGGFEEKLGNIYRNAYIKCFNIEPRNPSLLLSLSESIAPWVMLKAERDNAADCINIDIGGGTTDYALYTKNQIYVSSVKFAGNDIWGGGFPLFDINSKSYSYKTISGYVNIWKKKKQSALDNAQGDSNYLYFKAIEERKGAASEKTNILFKYLDLEFVKILKLEENKKLRLPLLLHFSCILWYLCQIMKTNEIKKYSSITFSGKGSSYLDLIFSNQTELANFVKNFILLFNEDYNLALDLENKDLISVIPIQEPKKVTAKGAVLYEKEKMPSENHTDYIATFEEEGANHFMKSHKKVMNEEKIKEVVMDEVHKFMSFFVSNSVPLDIVKLTGFNSIEEIESECNLFSFVKQNGEISGIKVSPIFEKSYDLSLSRNNPNTSTRFFDPFKETIYQLSINIANKLNSDQ